MCEALHQRTITIDVITRETNSAYGTNTKNTNFPTLSTLDGVVVFYFYCDNRSPDGRDVQAGLTDQMVYQRRGQIPHISCMWCLVQSARPSLHSNIFCGLLPMHVELILIFRADSMSCYICAP
jgi:hypothetical protein